MNYLEEQKLFEVLILSDEDVIFARQKVRTEMQEIGFGMLDQTRVVTAVSELARNIVVHAKEGKMEVYKTIEKNGIRIVFEDRGPGIDNIDKVMEEGFSSIGSLGIGLKGSKRLVDEFEIKSLPGSGTRVTIIKWI